MGRRGMSESVSCQESKVARLSALSDLVCKCSIDGLVVIDTPAAVPPLLVLTAALAIEPTCRTECAVFFGVINTIVPQQTSFYPYVLT